MTSDPFSSSENYTPTLPVPILGTVGAGLHALDTDIDYDGVEYLPMDPTEPRLRGRLRLVALRVNGDSMVSDVVARSVRPGSMVVVEIGAIPQDGNLVVAWLPNRDTAVLKQFRESSDAVLRSFNPSGPVFRAADEPIEIRGVVRVVQTYPP